MYSTPFPCILEEKVLTQLIVFIKDMILSIYLSMHEMCSQIRQRHLVQELTKKMARTKHSDLGKDQFATQIHRTLQTTPEPSECKDRLLC